MSDNNEECACLLCMIKSNGEVETWTDIDMVKKAFILLKDDYMRSSFLSNRDTIKTELIFDKCLESIQSYKELRKLNAKRKDYFEKILDYKMKIYELHEQIEKEIGSIRK